MYLENDWFWTVPLIVFGWFPLEQGSMQALSAENLQTEYWSSRLIDKIAVSSMLDTPVKCNSLPEVLTMYNEYIALKNKT